MVSRLAENQHARRRENEEHEYGSRSHHIDNRAQSRRAYFKCAFQPIEKMVQIIPPNSAKNSRDYRSVEKMDVMSC